MNNNQEKIILIIAIMALMIFSIIFIIGTISQSPLQMSVGLAGAVFILKVYKKINPDE